VFCLPTDFSCHFSCSSEEKFLDALKHSKYQPTHINGVPVEIEMAMMLDFKLAQQLPSSWVGVHSGRAVLCWLFSERLRAYSGMPGALPTGRVKGITDDGDGPVTLARVVD